MKTLRKVTKREINKSNMVALSYCQCQMVLNMFADNYKVGYNSGVYGWNYDLYKIGGCSIVTGYSVPYSNYSNKQLKNKLVELENKVRQTKVDFSEYEEKRKKWEKEFLKIFE